MAGRDKAARATDKITKELEEKLEKEYRRAAEETQAKLEDYLRRYEVKDEKKREELRQIEAQFGVRSAEARKAREEYKYWKTGQILIGERWQEMADTLSRDLTNTDMIARSIIHGYMPEVYALNHNYGTFEVESGTWYNTSYSLYSRETVERLWRENPKLLPDPKPNSPTAKMLAEHEDMRWNRDHLQSELLQGILQGESIPQLSERMKRVTDMDKNAAVRNARTMCTGAMNAGRNDAYKRAVSMGIPTIKIWSCAHDGRTRDSHLAIDGEECEVGKEFSNGCEYPGDPAGEPEEVYNCRCCMQCETKRSKHGDYMSELVSSYNGSGKFVSFDEWQEKKAAGIQDIFAADKKRDFIGVTGNGFDSETLQRITEMMEGAPEELKEKWARCIEEGYFQPSELPKERGGAYYTPSENTVHYNPLTVARGTDVHPPLETYFHEYGHNLDYALTKMDDNIKIKYNAITTSAASRETGLKLTDTVLRENSKFFANRIDPERYDELVMKFLEMAERNGDIQTRTTELITKWAELNHASSAELKQMLSRRNTAIKLFKQSATDEAYDKAASFFVKHKDEFAPLLMEKQDYKEIISRFKAENGWEIQAYGNMSDMLGYTTYKLFGESYPMGVGHKESYWKSGDIYKVGREAFAEITSSYTANNASLDILKQNYPESLKLYGQLLRGEYDVKW